MLPDDPKARKATPLVTGCLDYFPLALCAVARVSLKSNSIHNPGEPLKWTRHKSNDHADAAGRHLIERGQIDSKTGESMTAHAAWRILALLQIEEEARQHSALALLSAKPEPGPVVAPGPFITVSEPPQDDE